MLLPELLERSAEKHPDAVAVVDSHRVITFGGLDSEANRIARLLQDSGVSRHDRVLMALENSVEFAVSYFGILKAGAVAVPLPPGPQNNRLSSVVRDCAPTSCVVDKATLDALRAAGIASSFRAMFVSSRTPDHGEVDLQEAARAFPGTRPDRRTIDIDLAAIIYTSGTTGVPRGVMLSHLNFVANSRSIVSYLDLTAADRVMAILPFHYVYGLSLVHTHLSVGGSLVIENRFAFPNVVVRAMKDHAVTGLSGVPSTFAILLRRSSLATTDLPALRYVTQAGGPMAPALIREWRSAFPAVPLYVMYGATEAAARLAYLEPAELDRRIGSIGRAIPNVELRILHEDGTVAAAGEVGELVARGSTIALGYWNASDETRSRFGPEGYRTGDLGYADADGYLFLVGRLHDMLKVGAHRVGAREIEDVLHEHPGVYEAAVVGVKHEVLGEAPAAFVAGREGVSLNPEEILAFCRERLPEYKVPVHVTLVAELPKSASGKIDRTKLREAADRQPTSV